MNILSNPLYRGMIIAGLALLLLLIGYVAVFQPKQNEIDVSERQLESLRAQLADLKRVAAQKPQYLALTRQIQQRLTGVELTADTRSYIPTYLKQIEDLAKRDGLTVTAVTPVLATPSPTPSGGAAASPNPNAVASAVPVLGAAANAARGASANAYAANDVGAVTSGTTQTGPSAAPGQNPPAFGVQSSPVPAPIVNNPRLNAITYVEQSFTQVPVNMEMEGTFADFERFLRDLNKFPKLIGVGNATINATNQSAVGVTQKLKIVLPLSAYRLGPTAFSVRTRNGLVGPPHPAATPAQGGQ